MSMKQRHLQRLLERRYLPRHRRLAEIERVARVREASRVGHGVEDTKLVPVDHSASPARRSPGRGGLHQAYPDSCVASAVRSGGISYPRRFGPDVRAMLDLFGRSWLVRGYRTGMFHAC